MCNSQQEKTPFRVTNILDNGKEFDSNTALDYDTTKIVLEILGLVPGTYSKQTRRSMVAT